jgi:hypothetical protein
MTAEEIHFTKEERNDAHDLEQSSYPEPID